MEIKRRRFSENGVVRVNPGGVESGYFCDDGRSIARRDANARNDVKHERSFQTGFFGGRFLN
jgi:hypothetical protein